MHKSHRTGEATWPINNSTIWLPEVTCEPSRFV
jgi:hypothetical protein